MIGLRPARLEDARAIAQVHVDSWRTTYQGVLPETALASMSYDDREAMWRRVTTDRRYGDDRVAFVAEDDLGRIVGFVSGGPERTGHPGFDGELYAIYLLATHQGSGTGRRLFLAMRDWIASKGFTAMLLWVVADNPACRFYEAMGGTPCVRKPFELGGVTLDEIGYGWRVETPEASAGQLSESFRPLK